MNYYLKATAPKKISQKDLADIFVRADNERIKNGLTILTDSEKRDIEENINKEADRMGTLEMVEALVLNYSPKMKELKSQLDFQDLRRKFKEFDYSKLNYLELSEADYILLKKLMEHDNYCNRLPNGAEVPLKDIGEVLACVFNSPNVKPNDYEKQA